MRWYAIIALFLIKADPRDAIRAVVHRGGR